MSYRLTPITKMGIPDYRLRGIMRDYIRLVKVSEALDDDGNKPLFDFLIEFMERMIPIFARELEQEDKELDEYEMLKAAVLSATDIEAMVDKLLAD